MLTITNIHTQPKAQTMQKENNKQHDALNVPHSSNSFDRRQFLTRSTVGVAAAGTLLGAQPALSAALSTDDPFKLPPLRYPYEALEPYIDATTMNIHHTKHHTAYLAKLNAAVANHPDLAAMAVEDLLRKLDSLPADLKTTIQNHGGGHANHSLFWTVMAPSAGGAPQGDLAAAIDSTFGSLDNFKTKFNDAASSRFGSGWAWLVKSRNGLEILSTANQDSPLSMGKTPILGLDVWEHAYYLTYQNRRPEYINAFWNIVNWPEVTKRFG
jgi:Fe-Mn family superoxide dismutase